MFGGYRVGLFSGVVMGLEIFFIFFLSRLDMTGAWS